MDQRVDTRVFICIISDSTGDLASRYVEAARERFTDLDTVEEIFLFVQSEEQVREAMRYAAEHRAIVVFTLVDPDLRALLNKLAVEYALEVEGLVMDDLVPKLARRSGKEPRARPGHRVDAAYIKREKQKMDAIHFAIQHDDGQKLAQLLRAKIVIVGVSRVRKSQVSMQLALKGFMVANVPITLEVGIPAELEQPDLDPRRVYALTLEPRRLLEIRKNRIKHAEEYTRDEYASYQYIRQDLAQVEELRTRKNWAKIDGSGVGIEESAAQIQKLMRGHFPHE